MRAQEFAIPRRRALFNRAKRSQKRSQTGSDFSPLVDAFHPPFPALVEHYISGPCELNGEDSMRGRINHDDECIFDLPLEVSDLILSYLSPAALDAASHTCKYWRTRLLSDTWIPCSYLGGKEKRSRWDGWLSGKLGHRVLLGRPLQTARASLPSRADGTGNLYVIMEVQFSEKPSPYASYPQSKPQSDDSQTGNHYSASTALLSRPRPNSVYRNVAVAPTILKNGSLRAAVVWQTTNLEQPISKLCIYEIPKTVYYESCRSCNQNTSENLSATTEDLIEGGAVPRPHRLV